MDYSEPNYSKVMDDALNEYGMIWHKNLSNLQKKHNFRKKWYETITNENFQYRMVKEIYADMDWKKFSENPNLTWKIISNNLDYPWDWEVIASHKNITWKIIRKNPQILCYPRAVSINPNITFDIVISNLDYDWHWEFLLCNKNITWENIKNQFPNLTSLRPKYIHALCKNENVTLDIIRLNSYIKWDWYCLSSNTNIDIKFVRENLDRFLGLECFRGISKNKNITWDIICKNSDLPWDWSAISENENITWDIIFNNLDKPWNWLHISAFNKNITWEIILTNPDKPWYYHLLDLNNFEIDRMHYVRQKMQTWFRKSELKAELMANVWHPKNYEKFKYLDSDTFGEEL